MRRFALLPPVLFVTAVAACNAITGEHDRTLDEGFGSKDSGKTRTDADDDDTIADAGTDTNKPIQPTDADVPDTDVPKQTITLGTTWTSPNGATFAVNGTSTKITSFAPGKGHAMILPSPAPALPANYKVVARIRADERSEFGVIVRGRGNGAGFSAIVLSSRVSDPDLTKPNRPFLAPITVANDSPAVPPGTPGPSYVYTNAKVWVFEVDATDATVRGKLYREDDATVSSEMTFTDPTAAADRGNQVGFLAYGVIDATLLDYKITF